MKTPEASTSGGSVRLRRKAALAAGTASIALPRTLQLHNHPMPETKFIGSNDDNKPSPKVKKQPKSPSTPSFASTTRKSTRKTAKPTKKASTAKSKGSGKGSKVEEPETTDKEVLQGIRMLRRRNLGKDMTKTAEAKLQDFPLHSIEFINGLGTFRGEKWEDEVSKAEESANLKEPSYRKISKLLYKIPKPKPDFQMVTTCQCYRNLMSFANKKKLSKTRLSDGSEVPTVLNSFLQQLKGPITPASFNGVPPAQADTIKDLLKLCCGEDCMNRSLNLECNNDSCVLFGKGMCRNRAMQECWEAPAYTKPTPGKGWGLFAKEKVLAGTFVVEYIGEVVNDEMCEQRLWKYKRRGINHFHMLEITRDVVIDAGMVGGRARFINHSCDPNCIATKWTVNDEVRIGIYTLRDVEKDEEFTYDYQFCHFSKDPIPCQCGTAKCTGLMGVGRRQAKQVKAGAPSGYQSLQVYWNKRESQKPFSLRLWQHQGKYLPLKESNLIRVASSVHTPHAPVNGAVAAKDEHDESVGALPPTPSDRNALLSLLPQEPEYWHFRAYILAIARDKGFRAACQAVRMFHPEASCSSTDSMSELETPLPVEAKESVQSKEAANVSKQELQGSVLEFWQDGGGYRPLPPPLPAVVSLSPNSAPVAPVPRPSTAAVARDAMVDTDGFPVDRHSLRDLHWLGRECLGRSVEYARADVKARVRQDVGALCSADGKGQGRDGKPQQGIWALSRAEWASMTGVSAYEEEKVTPATTEGWERFRCLSPWNRSDYSEPTAEKPAGRKRGIQPDLLMSKRRKIHRYLEDQRHMIDHVFGPASQCPPEKAAQREAVVGRAKTLFGALDEGNDVVCEDKISDLRNQSKCDKCGQPGLLACCDFCNLSYHLGCIGLTEYDLPEGDWACPACKKRSKRQSRVRSGEATPEMFFKGL